MSNPLESWTEEQRSAYLYRACADAEAGTPRADLFTRLAGEAEAQAAIWRAQLTASGKPAPRPFEPELRTETRTAWSPTSPADGVQVYVLDAEYACTSDQVPLSSRSKRYWSGSTVP